MAGNATDAEDVTRRAVTPTEEDGEAAASTRWVALREMDGVVATGPVCMFSQAHPHVLEGRFGR